MLKKIINYFDHYRIVLIFVILLIITLLFLGINSYLFLHHDFIALTCTEELDDEYCYHDEIKILINPEESKNNFFEKYDDEIKMLQEKYNLE